MLGESFNNHNTSKDDVVKLVRHLSDLSIDRIIDSDDDQIKVGTML